MKSTSEGLAALWQRVRDWRHERYIKRLSARCCDAMRAGDRVMARVYWQLMLRAVGARSPSSLARTESRWVDRLPPSERTVFKRYREI